MLRLFALFTVLASLIGAAPWLLPVAKSSVRLIAAHDDPATLADLGLAGFDAAAAHRAITDALAADDAALAASFVELADARGVALSPDLRAQVAVANSGTAQAWRSAKAFGAGFITGTPEDAAGLAGAAVGDLTVWGDLRDASREGLKLARGEDPDELILGLSAAGLALSAGTYATLGAGLPARAGVTLLKGAKRAGMLSAGLARSIGRAVRDSMDLAAVRRFASGTAPVDAAALKSVVRGERIGRLGRMAEDVATLQAKAGTRTALEGLKVAENGGDLRRLARLAEAKGGQTLAIVKTLGRGALVVTGALLKLVGWAFVLMAYAYVLVSTLNGFCVACARRLWRGGRRRKAVRSGHRLEARDTLVPPSPTKGAVSPGRGVAGGDADQAFARVQRALDGVMALAPQGVRRATAMPSGVGSPASRF